MASTLYYPAGEHTIDTALRLASGVTIRGAGMDATSLTNIGEHLPWGDSATIQALQGHDFGVGYADAIVRADAASVWLDPAALAHYPAGTLCWTWQWAPAGVALDAPSLHVVRAVADDHLVLSSAPRPGANAICWACDGWRIVRPLEKRRVIRARSLRHRIRPGQTVLVTDGMTIANEPRGELRRVVAVSGARITLDRPIRRADYRADTAAVVAVNAIEAVTIAHMTIGAGPSGWAFYGKFLRDVTFIRCRFLGTVEINQSCNVRFIECRGRHLKINCTHDLTAIIGEWEHVTFEEASHDCTIAECRIAMQPGQDGIRVDDRQACERLAIADCVFRGDGLRPIAIEGRECRIERCSIALPPSDAHVYLGGDDSLIWDTDSTRGVVLHSGQRQSAQFIEAPGIALGWADKPTSSGTAVGLRSEAITDRDGTWRVTETRQNGQ